MINPKLFTPRTYTQQDVQRTLDALDKLKEKMTAERNSENYKQKKYEHNKNMYEDLDKFISETPPTDNIHKFQISGRDLRNGKKMYNEMKNAPYPDYEIFGANGGGYTCFGLYKSNDQKMYVIEVDIQTPANYVIIENEDCFGF